MIALIRGGLHRLYNAYKLPSDSGSIDPLLISMAKP